MPTAEVSEREVEAAAMAIEGEAGMSKISPNQLAELFPRYRRWVEEGKPPHGSSWDPTKRKSQYYYDHYHDNAFEKRMARLDAEFKERRRTAAEVGETLPRPR